MKYKSRTGKVSTILYGVPVSSKKLKSGAQLVGKLTSEHAASTSYI